VLRTWIERKLVEIAGIDDEVCVNLVISELESADEKGPNPKKIQITMDGTPAG
jgi:hypothetical protein